MLLRIHKKSEAFVHKNARVSFAGLILVGGGTTARHAVLHGPIDYDDI